MRLHTINDLPSGKQRAIDRDNGIMRRRRESQAPCHGIRREHTLDIRRRRDDSIAAERQGQLPREHIRAADMTGKQADDMARALIEHEHRRIDELPPQERGHRAHDDSRRHEKDQRIIAREILPHGLCKPQKAPRLRIRYAATTAHKDICLRQNRLHAPRRQRPLCCQCEDCRPHCCALRNMCENSGAYRRESS